VWLVGLMIAMGIGGREVGFGLLHSVGVEYLCLSFMRYHNTHLGR